MLKKVILILILAQTAAFGQNLLSYPESVVYDSLYNRYLISNWGSGHIIAMDSAGSQSYFISNQQCFAGLHLQDSILYVACREYGVKGFNIHNGVQVLNVPIPGTSNINDITADNDGFLYVSYPTESRIYKVDIRQESYWIYMDTGLNTPNGLYYDEENDRLLICSYRTYSPIQAIDFSDSTLYTITTTNLHNLDGMAVDSYGNIYVSSWYTNSVYVFPGGFENSPQVFSTHADDPADIYFDLTNDVLAVPLFFSSQMDFVQGFTGIDNITLNSVPQEFELRDNYPNPFNASTVMEFTLPHALKVKLEIVDVSGRTVSVPVDGFHAAGIHKFNWKAGKTPSGTYFCRMTVPGHSEVKTMILLK